MNCKKSLCRFIMFCVATLTLAACGGGGGGPVAANNVTKFAVLNGTQETPAGATSAGGTGSLMVDLNSGKVSGSITITGLTATAAHVHNGATGVAGPVIIPLTDNGNGVWTVPASTLALTASQIADFNAGNLYFNAHTTANPNGEIRGQINLASSFVTRFASLTGAQETPAVTTNAGGTGSLTVDIISGKVNGSITLAGINATAAHIHDGAVGVAGPVLIPLTETTAGSGFWSVPATATPLAIDRIVKFNAGALYFNAHSTANPNGEIRGQINLTSNPLVTKFASLNGSQETPSVTTGASAIGSLAVDTLSGKVISGSITITDLSAIAAHVHDGAIGIAGPVIIPLTDSGNGVWVVLATALPLNAIQLADFNAGKLYFNAHTTANPNGELRGQINLDTAPQTVVAVLFVSQIQPIFDANCTTNCHTTGGIAPFSLMAGVSLGNLVRMPSKSSPPGILVIPGNSLNSVLYKRISGTSLGAMMPLGKSPLSTSNQNLIKIWIDQGAKNN